MKRPYEQPICETFHVEHTRLLEVSIRHQDDDHPITVDSYDDSAAAEDLELESIIGVGSFGSNSTDNLDWTEVEPASRARMAACAPRVIAMEGGDQPAFLVETTVNGIDEIPRRADTMPLCDGEVLLCDGAATRGLPVEVVDNLLGFSSYAYHANGSAFYANVRATGSDDLDWGPGHRDHLIHRPQHGTQQLTKKRHRPNQQRPVAGR